MFETKPSYTAAYTHQSGASGEDEIEAALRWLVGQPSAAGRKILVLTGTKQQLEYSPLIKRLGSTVDRMSEAVFKRDRYKWSGGAVLALWPSTSLLALIDDEPKTEALAVVPWLVGDIDDWVASRRPIDLLGNAAQRPEPTISDPVVLVALEHLTSGVNLSSGLTHPSDKGHAIETFRRLKKARYTWDPDEVHAWALANGWDNKGAGDLRKYATGVLAGSPYKASYGLRPEAVELWRAEAATRT